VSSIALRESRRVRLITGETLRTCTFRFQLSSTYDHRILKIELPVRSAVLKQDTGGLVVRWVTTSEYPLLYVFGCVLLLDFCWWK
jgi:hypothetical protein